MKFSFKDYNQANQQSSKLAEQHALHKNMKFSIKDFYSKCDRIYSFLRIWLHLPKKALMENFIFWAGNGDEYWCSE